MQSIEKRDHMREEDMEAMRAGKFSIHDIDSFTLSSERSLISKIRSMQSILSMVFFLPHLL